MFVVIIRYVVVLYHKGTQTGTGGDKVEIAEYIAPNIYVIHSSEHFMYIFIKAG